MAIVFQYDRDAVVWYYVHDFQWDRLSEDLVIRVQKYFVQHPKSPRDQCAVALYLSINSIFEVESHEYEVVMYFRLRPWSHNILPYV
jgi:hypothetical protein